MNEALLRGLTPSVLGILVRRGADFAAAEDAVQDALIEALRVWPTDPPHDPKGWLLTVAWRRFLDATRTDAVRQITHAYLVPEASMAQRISRAKRTVSGVRFDQPGDVTTVLRVLYLVFNEGYCGDIDLAAEAIRLTRQLAAAIDHPEVAGLLALMLLHHARRATRTAPDGRLVPLAEQDRGRWDTASIAEGVEILQAALARDRLGEFQAQATIAALHAEAPTTEETDWVTDPRVVRRARTPDRTHSAGARKVSTSIFDVTIRNKGSTPDATITRLHPTPTGSSTLWPPYPSHDR